MLICICKWSSVHGMGEVTDVCRGLRINLCCMSFSDQFRGCFSVVLGTNFDCLSTSKIIQHPPSQRCSFAYLTFAILYQESACAMIHLMHDNLYLYMIVIRCLSNPLSTDMCQLRRTNSSKACSFSIHKSINSRFKIDVENHKMIHCYLDWFVHRFGVPTPSQKHQQIGKQINTNLVREYVRQIIARISISDRFWTS